MFWGNTVKITESNMIPPHQHKMYELVVCISATGEHTIAGRHYKFFPGRTFFLPESVPHQVIGTIENPAVISF